MRITAIFPEIIRLLFNIDKTDAQLPAFIALQYRNISKYFIECSALLSFSDFLLVISLLCVFQYKKQGKSKKTVIFTPTSRSNFNKE